MKLQIEQLKRDLNGTKFNNKEKLIKLLEAFLPLLKEAYEQGKNGEPFSVLPVEEDY